MLNDNCYQGRGYPDLATRQFLHSISSREIPIFALVDADPYGIDILCTYQYGSTTLSHEPGTTCPQLEYLGVKILEFGHDGVSRISNRDRKKAKKLLEREWVWQHGEVRTELQRMLFLGVKAEMNVVGGESSNVDNYVAEKLAARLQAYVTS